MMARLRRLPKRAARARAAELLATFDLADARHRRAGTYSGGIERRLDLAVSMIERPRLLFLDEPTTGSTLAVESTFGKPSDSLWTKESRFS